MYKNGLTKTKYKNKMRMFWTDRWRYKTVEWWYNNILLRDIRLKTEIHLRLLKLALEKMCLERKIDKDQVETLTAMLESSDNESKMLALLTMQRFNPKKFERTKDECINHTQN